MKLEQVLPYARKGIRIKFGRMIPGCPDAGCGWLCKELDYLRDTQGRIVTPDWKWLFRDDWMYEGSPEDIAQRKEALAEQARQMAANVQREADRLATAAAEVGQLESRQKRGKQ